MQRAVHIRTATDADADRLIEALVLGFAADPLARWFLPDGSVYLAAVRKIFWHFGGRAAMDSGTFRMLEDCSGYVTWLPPGIHIDEEGMESVLKEAVPPSLLPEVDEVFGRMAQFHPHEPHWYLPIVTIDPPHQGKGLGTLLMEDGLAMCDERSLVSYLEATSPRSVKLYERFGYRVLGEIQVGSSPPVFPMRREARLH
jgi:GNAT superfamily N-acetyltransferase